MIEDSARSCWRVVVGMAFGATALALLPFMTGAAAALGQGEDQQDGGNPTAVIGVVDNPSDIDQVVAEAWPADHVLQEAREGDLVEALAIGVGSVDSEGRFAIQVDPAAVPREYLSPEGLVHLRVSAPYGEHRPMALTIKALNGAWVDPMDHTPIEDIASGVDPRDTSGLIDDDIGGGAVDPKAGEATGLPNGVVRLSDGHLSSGVGDVPEVASSNLEAGDSATMACGPWAAQGDSNLEYVWIGDSFPISGTSGKMEYNSSVSHRVGVAAGGSGNWSASGSKTVSTGTGSSWAYSTTDRYYRTQFEYQHFARSCDWGLEHEYRPVAETGYYGQAGATRPTTRGWSCGEMPQGEWSRYLSSGNEYATSFGVRSAGNIGINMEVSVSYSTDRKLLYSTSRTDRVLCGNNDYPARAGRVVTDVDF